MARYLAHRIVVEEVPLMHEHDCYAFTFFSIPRRGIFGGLLQGS